MDLLKSAEIPNIPTRMMYTTVMNWNLMKILIRDLIKSGLLKTLTWEEYYARPDTPRKEERRKKPINPRTKNWYVITEKGKKVLENYNKILTATSEEI